MEWKAMTPGRFVKLALASALALGSWGYVFFGPTGVRQLRWMADSRQVVPAIESRLASDPRFAGIMVAVSTSGEIVVAGTVQSEADARELRALLGGITFPHGISVIVRSK